MKIGVGVGVLVLRNDKVLLGRRHSDEVKAGSALKGAGTWTMPGGKVEFGESFEQAAIREVKEETGMDVEVEVICVNQDIIEDRHFVTVGLRATRISGDPQVMEPDAIVEWGWFALDDLPSPLYFPSEKLLKNYFEKKFYLG